MGYRSEFRQDLFAGRTVIVTGSGSGIGRCTAHELASLGANVVLLGRRLDRLEIVEGEIRSDGGEAFAMACDIREEGAVIAAIETTLKRYGQIDGLVNNAGGQYRTAMKNISHQRVRGGRAQQSHWRLHFYARAL